MLLPCVNTPWTLASVAQRSLDSRQLLRACGGDHALARDLLCEMKSVVAKQVEDLGEYTMNDQFLLAAESAHSLKGAAATIGAEPLHRAASNVERAAIAENKLLLQRATNEIRVVATALVDCVSKILDGSTGEPFCQP